MNRDTNKLVNYIMRWANDPMWANYAEVPKVLLIDAASELENLQRDLKYQTRRAEALAATIRELRDCVTSDYETKERFINRVRGILSADPDGRLCDGA